MTEAVSCCFPSGGNIGDGEHAADESRWAWRFPWRWDHVAAAAANVADDQSQ
jgi:hypothetical protein